MPAFLTIVGLCGLTAFWLLRARRPADAGPRRAVAARATRAALHRFNVRRKPDTHPADSIDDPMIAAGALAVAFLELDDRASHRQTAALGHGLAEQFALTQKSARELIVIGHWLVGECNGPEPAIPRIGQRLYRLDNGAGFSRLMAVIKATAAAGTGLNRLQSRALDELRGVFHIA